jgi:hypothetical protein
MTVRIWSVERDAVPSLCMEVENTYATFPRIRTSASTSVAAPVVHYGLSG